MFLRVSSSISNDGAHRLLQNTTATPGGGSDVSEFAKDFAIILLLGTLGMICCMFLVYLSTLLMDFVSGKLERGQNAALNAAGPGISLTAAQAAAAAANRDSGALTRKAQMWGLELEERKDIMRAFFSQRMRILTENDPEMLHSAERKALSPEGNLVAAGDIEMGPIKRSSFEALNSSENTSGAHPHNESDSPILSPLPDGTILPQLEAVASLDQADLQGMCCICLQSYESGASVMSGTQCGHLFHFDCCQAWLVHQDHCPYCRQEMLRPAEFRQAAVEVLGEARVNQLLSQFSQLSTPSTSAVPPASTVVENQP
jgi:Ring finger domain